MYSHHLHIQFDLFVIFTLISNEAAYTITQKTVRFAVHHKGTKL